MVEPAAGATNPGMHCEHEAAPSSEKEPATHTEQFMGREHSPRPQSLQLRDCTAPLKVPPKHG